MNHTKPNDLLQKRTLQMQEELDYIRKITQNADDPSQQTSIAELIAELEDIRRNWRHILDELTVQRNEYRNLIHDLRDIKKIFTNDLETIL
jgi:molecular chaperone GrpE (heat shock protein)